MKKLTVFITFLCVGMFLNTTTAQTNKMILNADFTRDTISRHIYGHFAEHLGRGIYGGIFVGENSTIPNTRGMRNDVVAALKRLNIPNLRWPGGCFADEYHWMDGIGPREKRPKMVNTHWGGVVEDNSFGTHEFFDLCDMLGTEPYICGNVGSGSVEEMSKWVEYITFDGESPMANLRRQNGRDKPWKVKFWGVGNENWGCGGNMTADYYADQYKRYATYCRNYGTNTLFKIAGGPNVDDYYWTETLMKKVHPGLMQGVSLHNYTLARGWDNKVSATQFGEEDYFLTLQNTLRMEELVTKHSIIMDKYDPEKKIALMVDEWGSWYKVEPGTNPGFLFQQNSMRDALIAGINLNIFNNHSDRVKMSNIAQAVNVLQAIIFTEGEKMILTPTYYVFDMYKVHQDAALLSLDFKSPDYEFQGKKIPAISASASRDKQGKTHITLTNANPHQNIDITVELRGAKFTSVTGTVLTAKAMNAYNTFADPFNVKSASFNGAKISGDQLQLKLPSTSVVMLELQ